MIQATRQAIERRRELEAADRARFAERLGVEPDAWQRSVVQSNASQIILNCSRQSGKSTVSALLALHTAIYRAGSLILILAPALRQAKELFRVVMNLYHLVTAEAPALGENALTLELNNRSRIICLPGKEATIRGFAGVALLIADEAARVPDDLYYSIRPMLAVSGGRIILLSTPFGQRGFFHKEWTEGDADWLRIKVTAHECPRIPRDWLEKERETIGDWWFEQEYLCQFKDTIDQVFSSEHVHRALTSEITPLFEEF